MTLGEDRSHDAALRRIARARDRRLRLEDEETSAVVTARQVGVTWWDIAVAIGMQQPAATRKYKPSVDAAVDLPVADVDRDGAVAVLRRLRQDRLAAEREELAAVVDARDVGVTWQRIADTLGMAQPNVVVAYRRYAQGGRPPVLRRSRQVRRG